MKNILLIFITLLTILSCKAQQHIIPINDYESFENTSDYYLKDTDNDFDNYLGTWKYQNGNTSFTIILEKKVKIISPFNFYEDLLVGRYQYVENGIEKVNTLNDNYTTPYKFRINGNGIIYKTSYPVCDDCFLTERRVRLFIYHPTEQGTYGWLTLRYKDENGVKKLIAHVKDDSHYLGSTSPTSINLDIPNGYYTMIKQ